MRRLLLMVMVGLLLLSALSGCGPLVLPYAPGASVLQSRYTGSRQITAVAGTYEGVAKGYRGYILISVTVDATGYLADVEVMQQTETAGIGDVAIDQLPWRILSQQSLDVDVVAGATITSNAILEAAAQAAAKAGVNPSELGYHTASGKI